MTTRRSTDETNLADMIRRIVQTLHMAISDADIEPKSRRMTDRAWLRPAVLRHRRLTLEPS